MAADPRRRTILLLAANPSSAPILDLMGEHKAISRCLERFPKQHNLRVVAESAVTDDDLRRALLDYEPEIVHFSGHGTGWRGLVFEEADQPLLISGAAMAGLFGLCSTHVKCVVLNACYSEVQAQSIGSVVQYVIGMSRAIGDRAATKFSTGFYDALASGRSFTDAFQFGCNAISLRGIPESLTPTLIVNNRVHANENSAGPGRIDECQSSNTPQWGKPLDRSVQELIALLDFRADVILSDMERERGELMALESVARERPSDSHRDMMVHKYQELDKLTSRFAELHEKNKKALINGEFVLSHDITSQIQFLLFQHDDAIQTQRWVSKEPELESCCVGEPAPYWTYAKDYPGPLPVSLTESPNHAVRMWREAEQRLAQGFARRSILFGRAAVGPMEEVQRIQRIMGAESQEELLLMLKQDEEHIRSIEEERKKRAEGAKKKREAQVRRHEADREQRVAAAKALRADAIKKGVPLGGDRCPYCHFTYAWNGTDCNHCKFQDE
jgi:hypothetical protein